MALDQDLGLVPGAVGHHQSARPRVQQRPQHPGGGTTGTYQQDVASGHLHTCIDCDVVNQANSVGVVCMNAIVVKPQCVGSACQLGPAAFKLRGGECLKFERNRDVAAPGAALTQPGQGRGKVVKSYKLFVIGYKLPGKFGKSSVDLRRFAVFDRVAEYAVMVHGLQLTGLGRVKRCWV